MNQEQKNKCHLYKYGVICNNVDIYCDDCLLTTFFLVEYMLCQLNTMYDILRERYDFVQQAKKVLIRLDVLSRDVKTKPCYNFKLGTVKQLDFLFCPDCKFCEALELSKFLLESKVSIEFGEL